jgi:hypothetical protein
MRGHDFGGFFLERSFGMTSLRAGGRVAPKGVALERWMPVFM